MASSLVVNQSWHDGAESVTSPPESSFSHGPASSVSAGLSSRDMQPHEHAEPFRRGLHPADAGFMPQTRGPAAAPMPAGPRGVLRAGPMPGEYEAAPPMMYYGRGGAGPRGPTPPSRGMGSSSGSMYGGGAHYGHAPMPAPEGFDGPFGGAPPRRPVTLGPGGSVILSNGAMLSQAQLADQRERAERTIAETRAATAAAAAAAQQHHQLIHGRGAPYYVPHGRDSHAPPGRGYYGGGPPPRGHPSMYGGGPGAYHYAPSSAPMHGRYAGGPPASMVGAARHVVASAPRMPHAAHSMPQGGPRPVAHSAPPLPPYARGTPHSSGPPSLSPDGSTASTPNVSSRSLPIFETTRMDAYPAPDYYTDDDAPMHVSHIPREAYAFGAPGDHPSGMRRPMAPHGYYAGAAPAGMDPRTYQSYRGPAHPAYDGVKGSFAGARGMPAERQHLPQGGPRPAPGFAPAPPLPPAPMALAPVPTGSSEGEAQTASPFSEPLWVTPEWLQSHAPPSMPEGLTPLPDLGLPELALQPQDADAAAAAAAAAAAVYAPLFTDPSLMLNDPSVNLDSLTQTFGYLNLLQPAPLTLDFIKPDAATRTPSPGAGEDAQGAGSVDGKQQSAGSSSGATSDSATITAASPQSSGTSPSSSSAMSAPLPVFDAPIYLTPSGQEISFLGTAMNAGMSR